MKIVFGRFSFSPILVGMLAAALLPVGANAQDKKGELTFEKDILPIIRAKCIRCH
ncbi:MAG: hypothetical protein HON53_08065, partial [Planctomycetaceae bacterium]|nr:hypothetical protein [Planctomycetaceae bacterium]